MNGELTRHDKISEATKQDRKRDESGMEGLGDRNISEGIKRVPNREQRVHERLMLLGGRGVEIGRRVDRRRRIERGKRVEGWRSLERRRGCDRD